jgi:hypothetical protein
MKAPLHLLLLASLALTGCGKDESEPPSNSGGGQGSANPYGAGNGAVTFYLTPSAGYVMSSFTLGGTALGGFTQVYNTGASPTCGESISNTAITAIRPVGSYNWCATRQDGQTYSGTVTVSNGSCILRGITSADMGTCNGGGGPITCNWTYMPSCFQVTGTMGSLCGPGSSISVYVTNNCSQTMDVFFCLKKTNGSWDSGQWDGLAPGANTYYWTCDAAGQYKVWGIPSSEHDNCTGQPNCN